MLTTSSRSGQYQCISTLAIERYCLFLDEPLLFLIKKNVLTTSKTLCNCKVLTDSSILAEKSYFETTEIISLPKKENHKFRRGSSFS